MKFPIFRSLALSSSTYFLSCSIGYSAAIATPTWEGDPLTTSALYNFTTDDRTAAPDEFTNPYGTPSLLVEDVTPPGSGWQDPNEEFQSVRAAGEGGAWDLGPSGKMTFTVPVSNPLGLSSMDLEIHVAFAWQETFGPDSEPTFSLTSGSPTSQEIERFTLENDFIGDWIGTVWQASFEDFTDDQITLVFDGDALGSVLEQVSIQTRIIPEPSSLVFLGLGLGSALLRRNRR